MAPTSTSIQWTITMKKYTVLNMATTEVDITEASEVVHHNSEVLDVVEITTVNLTAAEGGHEKTARGGYLKF
jgi:hypothetical protein